MPVYVKSYVRNGATVRGYIRGSGIKSSIIKGPFSLLMGMSDMRPRKPRVYPSPTAKSTKLPLELRIQKAKAAGDRARKIQATRLRALNKRY